MNYSAAKAPYRATFRVQTVGIEQVEHCADPNYELMQDFSNQYSQMVIFKVGDDVRRVKLPFSKSETRTFLKENSTSKRTFWLYN